MCADADTDAFFHPEWQEKIRRKFKLYLGSTGGDVLVSFEFSLCLIVLRRDR